MTDLEFTYGNRCQELVLDVEFFENEIAETEDEEELSHLNYKLEEAKQILEDFEKITLEEYRVILDNLDNY